MTLLSTHNKGDSEGLRQCVPTANARCRNSQCASVSNVKQLREPFLSENKRKLFLDPAHNERSGYDRCNENGTLSN